MKNAPTVAEPDDIKQNKNNKKAFIGLEFSQELDLHLACRFSLHILRSFCIVFQ